MSAIGARVNNATACRGAHFEKCIKYAGRGGGGQDKLWRDLHRGQNCAKELFIYRPQR